MIGIIVKFLTGLFLDYWLNHLLFHPHLHIRKGRRSIDIVSLYTAEAGRNWRVCILMECVTYSQVFSGGRPRTQGVRCLGCKRLAPEISPLENDAGRPARGCFSEPRSIVDTLLHSEQCSQAWIALQHRCTSRHRQNIRLHTCKWYYYQGWTELIACPWKRSDGVGGWSTYFAWCLFQEEWLSWS